MYLQSKRRVIKYSFRLGINIFPIRLSRFEDSNYHFKWYIWKYAIKFQNVDVDLNENPLTTRLCRLWRTTFISEQATVEIEN